MKILALDGCVHTGSIVFGVYRVQLQCWLKLFRVPLKLADVAVAIKKATVSMVRLKGPEMRMLVSDNHTGRALHCVGLPCVYSNLQCNLRGSNENLQNIGSWVVVSFESSESSCGITFLCAGADLNRRSSSCGHE